MSVLRRVVLVLAAPVALVGSFAIAWSAVPGIHPCMSVSCGPHYDASGANVFGSDVYTLQQSIVMAFGIWVGVALLGWGIFPARWRRTPIGFGFCVLAFVIALALPSPETGSAPSVPCTTPGPDGPILGGCVTGPAPVDERLGDRALVATAGVLVFALATASDRRRTTHGGSAVGSTASA